MLKILHGMTYTVCACLYIQVIDESLDVKEAVYSADQPGVSANEALVSVLPSSGHMRNYTPCLLIASRD